MVMASKSEKLVFWIILGMLSVFFAEIIAGSSHFFTLWTLVAVIPLYTLHTIFFFYIVYSYGKPTLATLFTSGMLFGMYEAYMTKVIWISYIAEGPIFSLGGIALFETLLLVLFWHPVLAFMIPMLVGENYLTKSREIVGLLPKWINKHGKKLFIALIIFGGLFTSLNSPSVLHSLLINFFSGALVLVLIYLWRMRGRDKYSMRDLMPSKKAFVVISILLAIMYAVLTLIINIDRIPGFGPQAIVWIVYVLLITLLVRNLRKSRKESVKKIPYKRGPFKIAIAYLGLFVLFAVIGEVLNLEIVMVLAGFLLVIFPGLFLLYNSIRSVFRD